MPVGAIFLSFSWYGKRQAGHGAIMPRRARFWYCNRCPASEIATVRLATQPFMVGLASLLGVDSFLTPTPAREPVVLGSSQIGRFNQVIQAPSLDPRLEI